MQLKTLFKILVSLAIIFTNIGCDQITKERVRDEISANETINIVGDHFILTKVENTGAALSIGQNLTPRFKIIFLQIIPLLVLLFLFIYIIREKNIPKLYLIGFSFIIGGGLGNIYDRILFNSVTDFMYLEYGFLHTAIFNMADVSVVIGTLLILLYTLVLKIKESRYLRLQT